MATPLAGTVTDPPGVVKGTAGAAPRGNEGGTADALDPHACRWEKYPGRRSDASLREGRGGDPGLVPGRRPTRSDREIGMLDVRIGCVSAGDDKGVAVPLAEGHPRRGGWS